MLYQTVTLLVMSSDPNDSSRQTADRTKRNSSRKLRSK